MAQKPDTIEAEETQAQTKRLTEARSSLAVSMDSLVCAHIHEYIHKQTYIKYIQKYISKWK